MNTATYTIRGGDYEIDTETTLDESEANQARDESLEMVEGGPGGAPQGDTIGAPRSDGDGAGAEGLAQGPPPEGERPAGPPPADE